MWIPRNAPRWIFSGWVRFPLVGHPPTTSMDPAAPLSFPERAYDMAEVHPVLMLGITAACIPLLLPDSQPMRRTESVPNATNHPVTPTRRPWVDRVWAPRCPRGPLLGRGVGAAGPTSPSRPSDLSPSLCYAQTPLCTASVSGSQVELIESSMPMGQNLVVAICPYSSPSVVGTCPTGWVCSQQPERQHCAQCAVAAAGGRCKPRLPRRERMGSPRTHPPATPRASTSTPPTVCTPMPT